MSAEEWLAERARIEQAATEGPWTWQTPSGDDWPQADESLLGPTGGAVLSGWGYDASGIEAAPEDRAYIADARTSLPKAVAAIRAVLALHQPVDALNMRTNRVQPVCSERSCGQENGDFMAWPCPTVRAIEKALAP